MLEAMYRSGLSPQYALKLLHVCSCMWYTHYHVCGTYTGNTEYRGTCTPPVPLQLMPNEWSLSFKAYSNCCFTIALEVYSGNTN